NPGGGAGCGLGGLEHSQAGTLDGRAPPPAERTAAGRSGCGFRFYRRDCEAISGMDAGKRAGVVLPPHSRAAPALAALPRQRIKIRVERLFGAFGPEEIRLTPGGVCVTSVARPSWP